nr:MAG TPA: hypothetical protein [Caudoviricetes sp.]
MTLISIGMHSLSSRGHHSAKTIRQRRVRRGA